MDIFNYSSEPTFFAYDEISAEDAFERRNFARKLVDKIINEPGGRPQVISIVNPWGGGKSTLLNYIRDAFAESTRTDSKNISKCRITTFNPWRYSGEDQMLYYLFERLIGALNQDNESITHYNLSRLLPVWLRRTSLLADWFSPGSGAVLQKLFDSISPRQFESHLEYVREATRDCLLKTDSRVIVIMDDVDRLDPDEVILLFRSLKLTADLPNTTFIIAMDDEHVSEIIGKHIGGTAEAGRKHIEKIINVQLAVPRIPIDVFEEYAFERFVAALLRSNTTGDARCMRRARSIFKKLHLPFITTPRTIKSIENAYIFALSLLPSEVNPGDVLLLEATRLLHPKVYIELPQCMESLEHFTQSKRSSAAKNCLDRLIKLVVAESGQPEGESELYSKVKDAFLQWFPQLQGGTLDPSLNGHCRDNKFLCSPDYFWRYYSGAVHKRDVHDAVVTDWIAFAQSKESGEHPITALEVHVSKKYVNAFINKLERSLKVINDRQKPLIIIARTAARLNFSIASNPNVKPEHVRSRFASVVAECICCEEPYEKRMNLAVLIFKSTSDLEFNFLVSDSIPNARALDEERAKSSKNKFRASALDDELAEQSLFSYEKGDLPKSNYMICHMVWSICRNIEVDGYKRRVQAIIERDYETALHFLVSGCAFRSSESHKAACWLWKDDSISAIEDVVPLDVLAKALNNGADTTLSIHEEADRDQEFTLEELKQIFLSKRKKLITQQPS